MRLSSLADMIRRWRVPQPSPNFVAVIGTTFATCVVYPKFASRQTVETIWLCRVSDVRVTWRGQAPRWLPLGAPGIPPSHDFPTFRETTGSIVLFALGITPPSLFTVTYAYLINGRKVTLKVRLAQTVLRFVSSGVSHILVQLAAMLTVGAICLALDWCTGAGLHIACS